MTDTSARPATTRPEAAASAAAEAAPNPNQNRSTTPQSQRFREWISGGWAERPQVPPGRRAAAASAARHRAAISQAHPGERIVVAAGGTQVRSNDTDHPYRAHTAFAQLTGWGADTVPESVLVLEPSTEGHDATLFLRPTAGRDTPEFYANAAIGEFWVGPRPSLDDIAADLGLATRDLAELDDALSVEAPQLDLDDAELLRELSELRLVKDDWEIAEMRAAVAATKAGFEDVIRTLPEAVAHDRGERLVEGSFDRRARAEGNTVGYDTIAASGPHACILHWTRNDGPVVPGDVILVDAGIERESLFTADITRTLPVSGTFTPIQRRIYEAVREAADAAFAVVKPGVVFREVHAAAMEVIARRTAEWGLLPISAEESLDPELQFHRRWMVHGTSHHLGIDVHDCAQARREFYHDGEIREGMIFTIEPGLYFQPDDLTVPEEFRGIGVRIEDDVLVTADGCENLSADIPRTADEVEAWMREVAAR
ncbi:MAG: aminopeptidase P family protein [Actinomycetales bacterium]|nr:aminopeptidase P family protein [Actinomycetales bacterium]